jgi:hypothetical protein
LWYYFGQSPAMDDIDALWADLLSSDAMRIQPAWNLLSSDEQPAVLAHLLRMRDEDGWHPSQHASAAAALQVIQITT